MGRGKSSSFKGGILATCPVKFFKKWSGIKPSTFSTTLPNLCGWEEEPSRQTQHIYGGLEWHYSKFRHNNNGLLFHWLTANNSCQWWPPVTRILFQAGEGWRFACDRPEMRLLLAGYDVSNILKQFQLFLGAPGAQISVLDFLCQPGISLPSARFQKLLVGNIWGRSLYLDNTKGKTMHIVNDV